MLIRKLVKVTETTEDAVKVDYCSMKVFITSLLVFHSFLTKSKQDELGQHMCIYLLRIYSCQKFRLLRVYTVIKGPVC